MKFIAIQKTVRDLIAAHPSFEADAATTCIADSGYGKPLIEKSLADKGFSIAVWPPANGSVLDEHASGATGVQVTIVVRVEFEPRAIQSAPSAAAFVNQTLADIIAAVMNQSAEAGGVRFELSRNAFELMNFDEGLVAYHIRFEQFAVFGIV